MTPELFWTTLAALLTAALWIPYIVGVNQPDAAPSDFTRPPNPSLQKPWVHRAFRAHLNALETLVPHAALVLIAHQLAVSSTVTVWAATLYFWLRLAHAVGYVTGTARFPVRPLLFTAAFACTVAIGIEVLRLG